MFEEVQLRNRNAGDDLEDVSDEEDDDGRRKSVPKRKWDSFRDIPPKQESGSQASQEFIDISVKIQKVIAYIVTFIVVLVGGVVAKATVLLMTSQIYPTKNVTCLDSNFNIHPTLNPIPEERVLWTWVLLFVIWLPDIGTFIRSFRFCFFKNEGLPPLKVFTVVFCMETLYAVGIALLVFEVLPNIDVFRGAMLTNAVCVVPAILRVMSRDRSKPLGNVKLGLDVLAVIFQASALVAWPIFEGDGKSWWILPALLFTSCGWWLNYLPDAAPEADEKDKSLHTGFLSTLADIKKHTKDNLYWSFLIISLWKIIISFCLMIAIVAVQGDMTIGDFFNKTEAAFKVHSFNESATRMISFNTLAVYDGVRVPFDTGEQDWLYIAIVACAGSYCCYVFSKFACKIMIQTVGMALPNLLVVPCTVALLFIFDEEQSQDLCFSQRFLPHYLFWNTDNTPDYINDKLAWIWVLWLVSQAWITFHIWSPTNDRLASTEKLLTTPMYSGIVVDQSVCLNRSFDEDSIKYTEVKDKDQTTNGDDHVPHVIACATMWHESPEEMLEMFKSIVRIDLDQCARKAAREEFDTAAAQNNYYEYQTQIFFDDAFTLEKDGSTDYVINNFVRDMMKTLPKSVRDVYRRNDVKLADPELTPTPYGGRLVYTLPGKTVLTVHLKDKNKIRHRKRWSQCMYMYYLLGFKLMDEDILPSRKVALAHNTYLLALDGDIDFQPKAVHLLVDLMKKNDKLGAACGRIHPVGSGLMAWYQIFEYAIGHWLQKATEHMIGCVLCSPGCFSLFRGAALMDDNVMKTYTKDCDIARHYVQYDQGEDRWLCTLLLQRGWRVEYSAASDAYTHCPEDFGEFYNQRRRWVPSTMANILDLLGSYKRTILINPNISLPYILYQAMLLGGTILGPGTIFLMLVGAFVAAFKIDNWTAFLWNLIPILLFIGVCLYLKADIQVMIALIISTVYGLVMMAVLVGILIQIQEDGVLAPSTLFLFIVAGEIIVAGLMHPQEVYCLPSGAIYYITIPSMYLLLIIYSVCNLNIVSWGTREVAQKKTKAEMEEEAMKQTALSEAKKEGSSNAILAFLENFAPNQKEKGSIDFSLGGLFRCMLCTSPDTEEKDNLRRVNDTLLNVTKKLDTIEKSLKGDVIEMPPSRRRTINSRRPSELADSIKDESVHETVEELDKIAERDDSNPYWLEDDDFAKTKTKMLNIRENIFWTELIARYLKPIDEDKEKQKKIAGDLRELRDKMVLSFFMLNALFVTIVFLLQLNKDTIYVNWPVGAKSNITYDPASLEVEITQSFLKLEPIGLVFVIFFAIILVIQFTGMFLHRFETLCHVLSTTTIFPSRDHVSLERIIGQTIEGFKGEKNNEDETKNGEKDDFRNKRKTVMILEDEYKEKRPSLDVASVIRNRMSRVQQEGERELEARRNSSILAKRSSKKSRSSTTVPNRATQNFGHHNVSFNTIEEEKE